MRYWIALMLMLLIIVPTTGNSEVSTDFQKTDLSTQQEFSSVYRDWHVEIVFVNYQQSLVNEQTILAGLPVSKSYSIGADEISYDIDYGISYASESYVEDLKAVILTNSFNGTDTGTMLDEEALEYQKANPSEPQRIFYPRDGRAIDAFPVEDWMYNNPAVTTPQPGYILYFLNYSMLDSSDHTLEHWYDYHPTDPDSGEEQDWFRLEWDNSLNQDVEFEYPAFGGRYNFFVIDPSADQWYLQWARIWWDEGPDYSGSPQYCTKDLEDKMNDIAPDDPERAEKMSAYLNEWAYDPVNFLFFPNQNTPTSYVDSGFLKGLVFGMDVDAGISIDSLRWVTDADMQQAHLTELLPFIDWEVDIEFLDIDDYPDWSDLFWDHTTVVGGQAIVDGMAMFNDIYENMRYQYVDILSDDINVFGVVFIKKNMEMHAFGRQYTGLGGGGQTCIWKSWERYYRPDGETPKSGISYVQLHETMHAVGIGHTWNAHHYVGDFSRSPMGYYGRFNGTGKFDRNWVQGTYLDQVEGRFLTRYSQSESDIEESNLPKTEYANEKIQYYLEQAHQEYANMNWSACHESLMNADEWLTRAIYSMADQEPPIIEEWELVQSESTESQDVVWAKVYDALSGVDNVTVHVEANSIETVYVCQNYQGNWSTKIGILPDDAYVRVWIEATDWGMNSVISDVIEIGTYQAVLPLSQIIVASTSILIFVLVAIIWHLKRSRQRV